MQLNIEIPESMAAELSAKAMGEGVTASIFARQVLEQFLFQQSEQNVRPKKSAYGLLAQYGRGPSAEEIDENRREMFRGFAEDAACLLPLLNRTRLFGTCFEILFNQFRLADQPRRNRLPNREEKSAGIGL